MCVRESDRVGPFLDLVGMNTATIRLFEPRGYLWGSFLIAAAALKTPTKNGYNAQGVNLKIP